MAFEHFWKSILSVKVIIYFIIYSKKLNSVIRYNSVIFNYLII